MQEILLKVQGLYTHPSELSAVPRGALSVADDIVIDREEIAEPRRGFDQLDNGFSDASYRAERLFFYQDKLLALYNTNTLAYYNSGWTDYSDTYDEPSNASMRGVLANQNFYFTTNAGVYKLDAYDSTPVLAGAYKGLDIKTTVNNPASTSAWLSDDYSVAYRVVWGYRDDNDNLILGAPSQREVLTNTTGGDADVTLDITIPNGVTTNWFYQVYRSAAVDNSSGDVEPNDELGLVHEANPTSGEITAGSVSFDDITPDALRGATIYTAATQEGLVNQNEQPPLANDIAVYKDVIFYANTTSKHREYITLLGTGAPNGLQDGDTITVDGVTYTADADTDTTGDTTSGSATITSVADTSVITVGDSISGTGIPAGTTVSAIDSGASEITISNNATATNTGTTFTFSGENVTDATFKLYSSGSASQNIRDTSISLIRVINRHSNSTVYSYYLSGPDDLPGQILLEEKGIGGGSFDTSADRSTAWSPDLTTTRTSSNDRFKNGIFFSKTSEPEAVPLTNFFFVGTAQQAILRIVPLRDSLFILKEDGIYRLSGEGPGSFRVDLFDSTARLITPDSAQVLNNQIYALTDQGVVSITESGVQVRSRPIEQTLLSLLETNKSVLENDSFGVAYESERKYVLFVPTNSSDTTPTQAYVYNVFTNTWTRWVLSKTCGGVNPADDKLYLGDADSEYVNKERKTYSFFDYVDFGADANISGVSDTVLTMSKTDQVSVGDVIYQSDSVHSTVASVDTSAGTVTVDYTAGFSTGAAEILKAIPSKVAWVPFTSDNPGMIKQFRELTFLFKKYFTGTATIVFTSDTSPAETEETISGESNGSWGLFEWGGARWGGSNQRKTARIYVPRNKQRSSQLIIEFRHSTGYANYQLNGLSLIANSGSARIGK